MHHTQIINSIIKKHQYNSYLEIGVQHGVNFRAIQCARKVGVDPDVKSKATEIMTSDAFFSGNTENFDCIFVDGLHEEEQVYKDIENAMAAITLRGTIIVHDCNPSTEKMQQVPRGDAKEWTGNGWKAWVAMRRRNFNYNFFVIDTDYGVGVIRRGEMEHFRVTEEVSYQNFIKYRKEWLNLISVDEFRVSMFPFAMS